MLTRDKATMGAEAAIRLSMIYLMSGGGGVPPEHVEAFNASCKHAAKQVVSVDALAHAVNVGKWYKTRDVTAAMVAVQEVWRMACGTEMETLPDVWQRALVFGTVLLFAERCDAQEADSETLFTSVEHAVRMFAHMLQIGSAGGAVLLWEGRPDEGIVLRAAVTQALRRAERAQIEGDPSLLDLRQDPNIRRRTAVFGKLLTDKSVEDE